MTAKLRGTGRPGRSNVLSVRLDGLLDRQARASATADGVTVSEWIRRAVAAGVMRRSAPQAPPGYRVTGWACPHVHVMATVVLYEASCGYGCKMQPAYEPLPLAA